MLMRQLRQRFTYHAQQGFGARGNFLADHFLRQLDCQRQQFIGNLKIEVGERLIEFRGRLGQTLRLGLHFRLAFLEACLVAFLLSLAGTLVARLLVNLLDFCGGGQLDRELFLQDGGGCDGGLGMPRIKAGHFPAFPRGQVGWFAHGCSGTSGLHHLIVATLAAQLDLAFIGEAAGDLEDFFLFGLDFRETHRAF